MKDLRLKIIADFVKGGFDRATKAVDSLKAQFAEIKQGGTKAWGLIAAGAVAGIAVMMRAGDALKNHFINVFREMEQSRIGFGQNMDSWTRKAGKMKNQDQKDRLVEDVRHEIQNMTAKRDEMVFEDSLDSRLDKAKEEGERQINMKAGRGDFSNDELRIKRLDEQIFRAKRLLETYQKIDVKTPGQEFEAREEARFQEKSLTGVSMKEKEDMLSRRLATANEGLAKAKEALRGSPKNADLAEEANRQLDVVEKLEAAYIAAKEAREDFERGEADKKADATKTKKEQTEEAARKKKEREESIQREKKKAEEKKADKEVEEEKKKIDPLKKSLTTSHLDGFVHKGRGKDGGFMRKGGKWGRHHSFADGRAMAETSTPSVAPVDEGLTVAKESLKTLKNIEKKTGAAP